MVVRKRRQRKGLQSDLAEVTPEDMTFSRTFWYCVNGRKVKQSQLCNNGDKKLV